MTKTSRTKGLVALVGKLISVREAAGLIQRDFAKKLRTSQTKVARYEQGGRRIDVVELVVLARALEKSPEELIRVVADATPADQRI